MITKGINKVIGGILLGLLLGVILALLFTSKNKKENFQVSHNMIVEKIESMGNLEVSKYTIQDIVEYRKIRQWLPNAKTALIVTGEVTACIDLTQIDSKDIVVSGDSIHILLPAPQVCHVIINHSQSRIYDMEFGLWEAEKIADEAYRQAEEQLKKEALRLDISEQSRQNATTLLTPLLQAMGFKTVQISFKSTNQNFR